MEKAIQTANSLIRQDDQRVFLVYLSKTGLFFLLKYNNFRVFKKSHIHNTHNDA